MPNVEETSTLITEIKEASIQQNIGAKEIQQSVEQLVVTSSQNSTTSEQMAIGAEELSSQAGELKDLIQGFKIAKNSESIVKSENSTPKVKLNLTENEVSDSALSTQSPGLNKKLLMMINFASFELLILSFEF